MERPEAVLLTGPTASGKSALAMQLADELGGTVVNADSMQVYSTLREVTARPSREDEARAPHRLYGHVHPLDPMSAALYVDQARSLLRELAELQSVPIFVGGTGLYLRALEEGLSSIPEIEPAIRAEVRGLPATQLYEALQSEDPQAARRLRSSDTQRLARALEVKRSSGRSLLEWHETQRTRTARRHPPSTHRAHAGTGCVARAHRDARGSDRGE